MLRDAAVDLLMGRLARHVNTVTQQDIINEMDFAQTVLLEGDAVPFWFLLSDEQSLATVADQEYIAQPSDFLQEWEEAGLYYVDDDGDHQEMLKNDWDVVKAKITGTGKPEYYALAGERFLFRKLPDAIYTMYWRYYQKQTSLAGVYGDAANVENGWLKHAADLLMAETGVIVATQYLQSDKMAQMFMKQAGDARGRLVRKDTIMRETNVYRFMEG